MQSVGGVEEDNGVDGKISVQHPHSTTDLGKQVASLELGNVGVALDIGGDNCDMHGDGLLSTGSTVTAVILTHPQRCKQSLPGVSGATTHCTRNARRLIVMLLCFLNRKSVALATNWTVNGLHLQPPSSSTWACKPLTCYATRAS